MSSTCSDVSKLIPTYLDGELAESELLAFEHHLVECDSCEGEVDDERQFLDRVRDALAEASPANETFRARLMKVLDDEEDRLARAARREWWSWALPGTATLAAAAALFVFVFDIAQPASNENRGETAMAPGNHALEAGPIGPAMVSASRGEIARSASEYLRIPVRAPRFASAQADLRGWQPIRRRGHVSALFLYEVKRGAEAHRLEVQTLDARNLDLRSAERRVVRGTEVWVARTPGVSSVSYRDSNGVGYVFTSYMDTDDLVNLVVESVGVD
jgi:hypothetical protein